MKRCVLVCPPGSLQEHSNLGLGYIGAMARRHGHSVELLAVPDVERCIKTLLDYKPEVVGIPINGYGHRLAQDIRFTRQIRSIVKPPIVIVGGHVPTLLPDVVLKLTEADACVVGEGEYPFLDLLDDCCNWSDISGVAYDDGLSIVCRPPVAVQDLDSLAFPLRFSGTKENYVATSRGCNGACSFCSIQAFYAKSGKSHVWRYRSPENVLEEIRALYSSGNRDFAFVDDNFIGNGTNGQERARLIAEGLLRSSTALSFRAMCRPCDVDLETFSLLKRAGLTRIHLGVESLSLTQLSRYSKNLSPEAARHAVSTLRKLEVNYTISLIPWEMATTCSELVETFRGLAEIGPPSDVTSLIDALDNKLVLFPGCTLACGLNRQALSTLDVDYERALWDPTSEFLTYPWTFTEDAVHRAYDLIHSWVSELKASSRLRGTHSEQYSRELLRMAADSVSMAEAGADELALEDFMAEIRVRMAQRGNA